MVVEVVVLVSVLQHVFVVVEQKLLVVSVVDKLDEVVEVVVLIFVFVLLAVVVVVVEVSWGWCYWKLQSC